MKKPRINIAQSHCREPVVPSNEEEDQDPGVKETGGERIDNILAQDEIQSSLILELKKTHPDKSPADTGSRKRRRLETDIEEKNKTKKMKK